MNDFIKSQLLLNGNSSKDDIKSRIKMYLFMHIVDNLSNIVPNIVAFFKGIFNEYLKNKVKKYSHTLTDSLLIKSSIVYEISLKSQNITTEALIDYICKQNSALKLRFKNGYIVNNMETFEFEYEKCNIKCKIQSIITDKESDSMIFEIFSYQIDLYNLRQIVSDIENKFIIERKNKLGTQKYYFNEIATIPPKNMDDSYRLEQCPKNISFGMTKFNTNKNLNNIFGHELKEVKERVDLFINCPNWYEERGVPHTLGLLLYGPPGTGKTSTIKAIAKYTNRHIFNLSLRKTTTKTQLNNLFLTDNVHTVENGENKIYNIPVNQRIYILEDVDCLSDVFISRDILKQMKLEQMKHGNPNQELKKEPVEHDDALNLSYLLNLLDGILEVPGRLLIMTSNHPEKLDPALLRPGRMDLVIKFGKCHRDTIDEMFRFFFKVNKQSNGEEIIFDESCSDKITPAELSRILCSNSTMPDLAYNEILRMCKATNVHEATETPSVSQEAQTEILLVSQEAQPEAKSETPSDKMTTPMSELIQGSVDKNKDLLKKQFEKQKSLHNLLDEPYIDFTRKKETEQLIYKGVPLYDVSTNTHIIDDKYKITDPKPFNSDLNFTQIDKALKDETLKDLIAPVSEDLINRPVVDPDTKNRTNVYVQRSTTLG